MVWRWCAAVEIVSSSSFYAKFLFSLSSSTILCVPFLYFIEEDVNEEEEEEKQR